MPRPNSTAPTAPPVVTAIPRAIVRVLDMHDVLLAALNATNHSTPYGPVIALDSIASYLDAAKRQQRRIERAKRIPWRSRSPHLGRLFADVHYYLICWARIAKLARFIASSTGFREAGRALRQYDRELKDRIDARDHLEHFEERLPGGRKQDRLKVPNDLVNMMNQCLTYGGRTLEVGPASIRLLAKFVNEFRKALLLDSVKALENADASELSRLLQRAARDVYVARVMKRMRK